MSMCNFCHAPEHAYDALLEDDAISRDGLCNDAQERLRMAATPLPEDTLDATGVGLQFQWDEYLHAWTSVRDWGYCAICGGHTWKDPDDPREQCCSNCTKHMRLFAHMLQYEFLVPLVTHEEADALQAHLPKRKRPLPRNRLRFSDYEVQNTRDFEGEPGPRTYRPKPYGVPYTTPFATTRRT